ncbi:MAG: trp operon repressor [Chlamydiales bacterium]
MQLCCSIDVLDDIESIFDVFFTIEEKETLASRFLIIKALLDQELTQREIAEKHKVSIAQITRGSNALKVVSSRLKEKLKNKFDLID